MDTETRLRAICTAVDSLNYCVARRGNPQDTFATLGEIDWLVELERILYDEL